MAPVVPRSKRPRGSNRLRFWKPRAKRRPFSSSTRPPKSTSSATRNSSGDSSLSSARSQRTPRSLSHRTASSLTLSATWRGSCHSHEETGTRASRARSTRWDSPQARLDKTVRYVQGSAEEEAMTGNAIGDLWRNNEQAYAVVTAYGASERPERAGLSHAEAMTLAEELGRDGKVASVMHVIGD